MYEKLPMYQNIGASAYKKDLSNIRLICGHLGDPQNNFKSIHVAGNVLPLSFILRDVILLFLVILSYKINSIDIRKENGNRT